MIYDGPWCSAKIYCQPWGTHVYLQWLISTLKRRHREARHRPEIVRDDTSTSTRRYQLHNKARTPITVEEELCTPRGVHGPFLVPSRPVCNPAHGRKNFTITSNELQLHLSLTRQNRKKNKQQLFEALCLMKFLRTTCDVFRFVR